MSFLGPTGAEEGSRVGANAREDDSDSVPAWGLNLSGEATASDPLSVCLAINADLLATNAEACATQAISIISLPSQAILRRIGGRIKEGIEFWCTEVCEVRTGGDVGNFSQPAFSLPLLEQVFVEWFVGEK